MKKRVTISIGLDRTSEGLDVGAMLRAHGSSLSDTLRKLLSETARRFGGYTESRGMGGWYDPSRSTFVEERSTTLTLFVDATRLDDLRDFAAIWAESLHQACVLLVVEDVASVEFIAPARKQVAA